MFNFVNSSIKRENGIGIRKYNPLSCREDFFGSRYIMERIKHRDFLTRPITCMSFNNEGDLICGTFRKNLILYDWDFKKEQAIFESSEFEYFSEMKCQTSSKSDMSIIATYVNYEEREKKIIQTCIEPSGNISIKTVFESTGSVLYNPLCFTLAPQDRNEIVISSGGNISTLDLRLAPYSYLDRPSNAYVSDENGWFFEIEDILHHPYNPEICVYGDNSDLHVYDKRKYKTVLRRIRLGSQPTRTPNFLRRCSYNYDGSEFLARRGPVEVILVKNNDKGEIIQSYKGLSVHKCESRFFGPKSTHIICSGSPGRARTPRIYILDKKTGELINDTPIGRYIGMNALDFKKGIKVQNLHPHPKLPFAAVHSIGFGVSFWSVPNINFTNKKKIK